MTKHEDQPVNRIIVPLMKKIHKAGARKISVLTWDSDELAREVARFLAVGFSRALDQKCAVVISEGLRARTQDLVDCILVTVAEDIDEGKSAAGPRPFAEREGDIPLFFIAGGSLTKGTSPVAADAYLFVLPRRGVCRGARNEINAAMRQLKLNWLGIVLVDADDFPEMHNV